MNIYILTMHALRGPLAVALESMLLGYGINTLDELVAAIRSGGHRLAEYMDSNECRRAAYAAMQQQLFVSRADAQTQTDKQVSCRSSQTVLTDELIDVITVDEVVDEAMGMLAAADIRVADLERQAQRLEREAELAAARLHQRSEAARRTLEAELADARAAKQGRCLPARWLQPSMLLLLRTTIATFSCSPSGGRSGCETVPRRTSGRQRRHLCTSGLRG